MLDCAPTMQAADKQASTQQQAASKKAAVVCLEIVDQLLRLDLTDAEWRRGRGPRSNSMAANSEARTIRICSEPASDGVCKRALG